MRSAVLLSWAAASAWANAAWSGVTVTGGGWTFNVGQIGKAMAVIEDQGDAGVHYIVHATSGDYMSFTQSANSTLTWGSSPGVLTVAGDLATSGTVLFEIMGKTNSGAAADSKVPVECDHAEGARWGLEVRRARNGRGLVAVRPWRAGERIMPIRGRVVSARTVWRWWGTTPRRAANGNGWGRPISMNSPIGAMNYWLGSWVDGGGGAELRSFGGSGWNLDGATYSSNFPGSYSISGSSITYTVSL
ncbi:MAG: hypothetical protein ACKOHI_12125, partial [Phycisphaerales bacterium]